VRVTLLVTTFNSLSQAVYVLLKEELGYKVDVTYALNEEQMLREIDAFSPDVIFAPFLKRFIPPSIFTRYATFVFHPGPVGDRGAYALEHAVYDDTKEWGAVILRVNETLDGGEICRSETFTRTSGFKARLYRNETTRAALKMTRSFFKRYGEHSCKPQTPSPMHTRLTQDEVRIDWQKDDTATIVRKIGTLDSFPGVRDEISGVEVELFGAHREEKLGERSDVAPKTILAKRDGAICLKTVDAAVWISHLKEPHRFKLPATYVLKSRLQGIKEHRLPLIFDESYATFYEVSAHIRDGVGYLYFHFHNGAMSASQCMRLKYAVEYLKERCDVLVLMGGDDFFSNGIHLNILEDSKKQGEDGWENINAMNDLVASILYCEEAVTIAAFRRNAGAGGVFLGLACDFVVAREGVVLNPHYKTLGLSGSEYHTYTLPKRIGEKQARTMLETCLPVGVRQAERIGMIDAVFDDEDFDDALHRYAVSKIDDDWLWDKVDRIESEREKTEACKEAELKRMYPEFWEESSPFHRLRHDFVYKVCPTHTPERLKYKG
jgi:putative two-component system hydrogenase maturation factor HypX/HoxX